jgi:hypothetical protein
MIVLCRSAPYIERTQLSIRHFHWLMIVSCKCCAILSSARVGGFPNWSYGNIFCRIKWLGPVDFHLNDVKMLKPVLFLSWQCPFKIKNKAMRFYSLSEQIVWVYSFFWPPYMEADSTFKGPNQVWSWLRRCLRGGLTELGICLHSQGRTGACWNCTSYDMSNLKLQSKSWKIKNKNYIWVRLQ